MKYALRLLIQLSQLLTLCVWCFFMGSIMAVLTTGIGFMIGINGGGWTGFYYGIFWCLSHLVFLPFTLLYLAVYGEDEWYKSETFFGI